MGERFQIPACRVCDELARADERYAYHLSRHGRIRRGLGEALALNMGLCVPHARFLARAGPDVRAAVSQGMRDARVRIVALLRRASLQDEQVQDILFGARRRCPACAFAHRLAGRPLSRLMRDVEAGRAFPRTLFSTSLCFEHARQMVLGAAASARPRLSRALRLRGRTLTAAGGDSAPGEAGIGAWLPAALFPYLSSMASVDAGNESAVSDSTSDCPVCLAQREAELAWLASVTRNIHLGQPAWLTAPTCAEHAALCLNRLSSGHMPAVFPLYIDAAIASTRRRVVEQKAPAKKRHRDPTRWFDTPKRPLDGKGEDVRRGDEVPDDEPVREPHCPGCLSRDIAMRAAVSSFLYSFAGHPPSRDGADVGRLCLKHLAETLILAPDAKIRARLTAGLTQSADDTQAL